MTWRGSAFLTCGVMLHFSLVPEVFLRTGSELADVPQHQARFQQSIQLVTSQMNNAKRFQIEIGFA